MPSLDIEVPKTIKEKVVLIPTYLNALFGFILKGGLTLNPNVLIPTYLNALFGFLAAISLGGIALS